MLCKTEEAVSQLVATDEIDPGMLRRLGEQVERLTGNRDRSFFTDVRQLAGHKVVLIRALCALYEHTLDDGGASLSGAITASMKAAAESLPQTEATLCFTNIAMVCQRKGEDGVEDQIPGCVDPKGEALEMLAVVKQLHFLGLKAAGVEVVGIVLAGRASQASVLGKWDAQQDGSPIAGTGTFEGVCLYPVPHPKYGSATACLNKGVAHSLGANAEDPLAVPTKTLLVYSRSVASALGLGEDGAKALYEAVRKDGTSRVTVREYERRDACDSTPGEKAQLAEELSKKSRVAGVL